MVPGGVGAEERCKAGAADVLHQDGLEDAVVHPGLRDGGGAAAVAAAVAHGGKGVLALQLLVVHGDLPVLADAPEEEVHHHAGKIAAPAGEKGGVPQLMDALGHPGVDAAAGDGEAVPAVALDEVQGELGPVPEVLRVREAGGVGAEVLQEVVAGADGDAGHGGVGEARETVGHLVHGAVAAAGVDPDLLPGLRQPSRHVDGPAGALRQKAVHAEAVLLPQGLRHGVDPAGLVLLPRLGVHDENVPHTVGASLGGDGRRVIFRTGIRRI